MKTFHQTLQRHGRTWSATLVEGSTDCNESVWIHEEMGRRLIHECDFPTSSLGDAGRDDYCRAMLGSIATMESRK